MSPAPAKGAPHASRPGQRWRTAADVREAVRRRWRDGSLLRAHGLGEDMPSVEVPLRGPRASQIGEQLTEVRRWIADLEEASGNGTRFTLVYADVGGRTFGRNQLPSRAVVSDLEQAWALLGTRGDAHRYSRLLAAAPDERVRTWLLARPLRALDHAPEWEQVLAAYRWLDGARGSGRYLRQIDAPGVDTKFVEGRRGLLGELLGVPGGAAGFLRGLGLQARPEHVRMRLAPHVRPLPVSELAVRVEELAALDLPITTAVVAENEITYLTLPVPAGGAVIWGRGFDVERLGRWPVLQGAEVHYWGDLDSHGFAILDRLRAHLPQARSFLMDAETLAAHRERWVQEAAPTRAALGRLTAAESAVYDDLVSDRHGERVRLEQERVDWAWVTKRLPYGPAERDPAD